MFQHSLPVEVVRAAVNLGAVDLRVEALRDNTVVKAAEIMPCWLPSTLMAIM